ncbi:MAG TPA: M28 family metallopeptidase [Steroidobacteraceae bacterium]|nr:M28 family metallopeptidase [Steroidobacteraceae bacterium]
MHQAFWKPCTLLASALLAVGAAAAPAITPIGFMPAGVGTQRALEQKFDAQLQASDLEAWMKQMAAKPTHVGAPHDKANAELTQQLLRSWGWDAQIEQFDVLYPTLKQHSLELVAPTHFTASLKEPPIEGDSTSTQTDGVPPYHAYGGDGDVTAPLVYVNFGMPDDYKELARRNVDVKGKIVIVRYGAGWRGLKPKLAQEHGAVGCLIYSDPHEDGYFNGDTYPKGGWRPPQGVQRGSVLDLPVAPGDPLTPNVGATKGAKRLKIADAKTILKIPVMPISYADAQPLLAALGGQVVPPEWRGALPITYHVGPGPATVHLSIQSDWSIKPLYNVIGKIAGSVSPDEWVVRGNHRDGWVFGAGDPLSGHVAMMAEAKAIGALLEDGWRPKRTLVYASWDGEEPGLLGSTEWAEAHAEELQRKAVVYINSDGNSRGFLSAGGSHSLQRLVNEVAKEVKDPQTGVTVKERLDALSMVKGYRKGASPDDKDDAKKALAGEDFALGALGSGSDFTPFLQHLGLTTLNVGYGGEDDQDGVYHSNYDSFDHYVRFGDPGFVYGVAEAQTVGRLVLRIADAGVLPMEFGSFAATVDGYVKELHELADGKRKQADELAKLLDKKVFELAADPTRRVAPPARDPEVPYLNLAALDNAVARVKKSAKAYDDAYAAFAARGTDLSAAQATQLNALLRGMEATLINSRGLPGREWYRHYIYAPGLLTGYGVKTLPGVREAIEENQWDRANQFAVSTADMLAKYAERLDQATALLPAVTSEPGRTRP